jgi:hypothetical protein
MKGVVRVCMSGLEIGGTYFKNTKYPASGCECVFILKQVGIIIGHIAIMDTIKVCSL